jgi:hypothetical protein
MNKANEPAFPIQDAEWNGPGRHGEWPGLSKREYFAAMAMQGLAGNLDADSNADPQFVARDAVSYADALLAELEKGK